jgi:DNA-binding response OmpR family regulator
MTDKKEILVVDDTKYIREILRFSLAKVGYEVIMAGSGRKALDYAMGPNPPDLIILDIMMPKMDGFEVLRRLRENDGTCHIPVIFLTAKAQKKDVIKGFEAGGDDYVAKPFKFAVLQQKIEKLTGGINGHFKMDTRLTKIPGDDTPGMPVQTPEFTGTKGSQETEDAQTRIPDRTLSAIMITDIVDFSKKMGNDEEQTYLRLLRHNEIIRQAISENRGEEIKTIGDAFLVKLKSAVDAVKLAMDIQQKLSEYNKGKELEEHITIRIGIHLGDILVTDDDIFGNGVNIASRIEPLADPGGICISADVYNVVKRSVDINVSNLGMKNLKNIKDPIEVYNICIE